MVGALDGSTIIRETVSGLSSSPEDVGIKLAEELIGLGTGGLLDAVRVGVENASMSTL